MLSLLGGCSYEWQRKFIRQTKVREKKIPRFDVYQEQRAFPELYREHFTYWKSWHRDLIENLGRNRKKDMRNLKEARRQLESLAKYLQQEKVEVVKSVIISFDKLTKALKSNSGIPVNYPVLQKRLEFLQSRIERNLRIKKVKDYFLPTPAPIDMEAYQGEEPIVLLPKDEKREEIKEGTSPADSDKDADSIISYEDYRALPIP